MKFHKITWLLLIIGGLNWLLVGVLSWDIGALFGGQGEMIPRIIYILVGLSAIYELFSHKKTCADCTVKAPAAPMQGGQM